MKPGTANLFARLVDWRIHLHPDWDQIDEVWTKVFRAFEVKQENTPNNHKVAIINEHLNTLNEIKRHHGLLVKEAHEQFRRKGRELLELTGRDSGDKLVLDALVGEAQRTFNPHPAWLLELKEEFKREHPSKAKKAAKAPTPPAKPKPKPAPKKNKPPSYYTGSSRGFPTALTLWLRRGLTLGVLAGLALGAYHLAAKVPWARAGSIFPSLSSLMPSEEDPAKSDPAQPPDHDPKGRDPDAPLSGTASVDSLIDQERFVEAARKLVKTHSLSELPPSGLYSATHESLPSDDLRTLFYAALCDLRGSEHDRALHFLNAAVQEAPSHAGLRVQRAAARAQIASHSINARVRQRALEMARLDLERARLDENCLCRAPYWVELYLVATGLDDQLGAKRARNMEQHLKSQDNELPAWDRRREFTAYLALREKEQGPW